MNPTETNWLPGLLMLAAGAVAALAYVFTVRRPPAASPQAGLDDVDDLDARYQAKLAELKEHQANRHLATPEAWSATQARLEADAAKVLKEKSALLHERNKAAARADQKAKAEARATESVAARHPALTGALVGGAVVAFVAFASFQLSRATGERGEGMSATGGPRMGGSAAPAEREDPLLVELARSVQASPESPEAVGRLAMYLVRRQAFDDARPLVARVTQLDAYDVRGRVARAVLRAVDGDAPGAQTELEHLSGAYPDAYDARLFAGLIAMESDDRSRALQNLETYVRTAPITEQPPVMSSLIEQLRAQVGPSPR